MPKVHSRSLPAEAIPVVSDPANRYNLNSYSPLTYELNGSSQIAIGPKPVAGIAESNWLPAPRGRPSH